MTRPIRYVLRAGASVFTVSAIVLLAAPEWFTRELGLDPSAGTTWTMRMLAAALLGLAGQMALVSRGTDVSVRLGAVVMLVAGGLFTLLTFVVPGPWTWLRWAYVGFGATFWLAYVVLLIATRPREPARATTG